MNTRNQIQSTGPIPATSLIDRLQLHPKERDAKSALLRDLFNLFNTKLPEIDFTGYDEAANSIANYGLTSLNALEANSQQAAQQIQTQIETLLKHQEPRLQEITVYVNKIEKTTITFSITASLLNDPDPITIKFDSSYQPALQEFKMKDTTAS